MKADTRQDYEERILRVLIHLQQNLEQEPSLEDLAAVAHFSPFHFHRIFRGMTGESVAAYKRRLRLEWAAGQLRQTSDTVIRIALAAGFESHAAFSRAFKTQLGHTPSEWRTAVQSGTAAAHCFNPRDLITGQQGDSGMETKIVKEDEVRVAFVRHVGPYEGCGAAWSKMCTHLGAQGRLAGGLPMIGLSYDDPEVTPADKIRYDACVPVSDDFEPAGGVGVQVLPAGTFVRATHHGPYEKLNLIYAALMGRWLPDSGRRAKLAPSREIYLNDPESTAPEDLVTDILVPLEDEL